MAQKSDWSTGDAYTAAAANALATAVNDLNTAAVVVATGSETRPDTSVVLWLDTRPAGAARPTNMGATDLWFAQGS